MNFIEVEKSVKEKEWAMTDLHSHPHYEIYFLVSGKRKMFIGDRMYNVSAPCLIVIPPYVMHKTEGQGFTRININVSQGTLNSYQLKTLKDLSCKTVLLSPSVSSTLFPLLEQAAELYSSEDKFAAEKLLLIFGYITFILGKINADKTFEPVRARAEKVSPLALKIIDYVSANYTGDVSLNALSEKFFISKAGLLNCFKKAMNCTIGEYALKLRLNKAKQYLSSTKKSVEEIASLCGFSSGAYMGLIFKSKAGLSPLQYRKLENSKK